MRTTFMFLVMLTIACMISTQAAPSAAQASATEVKVGLGIDKLDVTEAADSFKVAPDTKIYGWARVRDVAAGSNVSIVFSKGDKEVYRKEVSIPSVPYRINAYRTFRSGDAGDWKLSIAGPDAKEIASMTFKVEITK